MQKVNGIGGVFFKARDPAALAEWYDTHLGVAQVPDSYDKLPWMQQTGPTVFAAFDDDSDYFGRAEQRWMINFRVDDLDAMIAQLNQSGIEVVRDEENYPNGRFARLHDPEGNPIELWEPAP